jgi:hypothetical protein
MYRKCENHRIMRNKKSCSDNTMMRIATIQNKKLLSFLRIAIIQNKTSTFLPENSNNTEKTKKNYFPY